MAKSEEESVGFKRPPAANRFRPGQSGNPAGRPPGSKNLRADLSEELAELISVSDGSRSAEITKQRAMVKAVVAKAMKGDVRAAMALFAVYERLIGHDDAQADDAVNSDQRIVDDYVDREIARRQRREASAGPTGEEKDETA
jgi:hypothetical protein